MADPLLTDFFCAQDIFASMTGLPDPDGAWRCVEMVYLTERTVNTSASTSWRISTVWPSAAVCTE